MKLESAGVACKSSAQRRSRFDSRYADDDLYKEFREPVTGKGKSPVEKQTRSRQSFYFLPQ